MSQTEYGRQFDPAVRNIIRLTLAFAKAVGAHQKEQDDNLVVSPYNHLRFLSMVAKGASGDTREELAQTLFNVDANGLDDKIAELITLNQTILDANKDQVTLSTAAGLWANSDRITLAKEFAANLGNAFGARVSSESFSNPAVLKDINGWASDSTNGLITKILDQLDADMVAVLASALYFKGSWTNKFDKGLTEDKGFTADSGEVSLTPVMKQEFEEGDVTYNKGGDYEAVALTYGEKDYRAGKQPSMRIVLVRPTNPAQSARDWLASQADGKIPAWLDSSQFRAVEGAVELPRMDIKQTHDLKPALQAAGLKNTLSPAADFSEMTTGRGKIELSAVKEDIVFKTDEVGSEAASIVSGVFRATSIRMPPPRIDVKFDRSYIMAVQDIETGAVLFAGAVNKPNNDMKPAAPAPR